MWGGLLGLLPFWVLALIGSMNGIVPSAIVFNYLSNYAALIVTFTGAIWWGLALSQTSMSVRNLLFTWSLIPCLLAWGVLTLPTSNALWAFSFLLLLQLLMDYIFLWRRRLIVYWVWCLRRLLTVIAVPSLVLAALQSWKCLLATPLLLFRSLKQRYRELLRWPGRTAHHLRQ